MPKVPESGLWVDSAVICTLISLPQQTPEKVLLSLLGSGQCSNRLQGTQLAGRGGWQAGSRGCPPPLHAPSSPSKHNTAGRRPGGLSPAVLPPSVYQEKCQTYKKLKEFSSEFPHTYHLGDIIQLFSVIPPI